MIDFWEAIGRLATYKDLNEKFLRVLPPVGRIEPARVHSKTLDISGLGLDIPGKQYQAVQDFFHPILAENFLSLASAGELLWTYNFNESREAMNQLIDLTRRATPDLFDPSSRYFITLGLLIVDKTFRQNLQNKEPDAVKIILRLSYPENNRIVHLASDPKFRDPCDGFGKKPWDIACNVGLSYWEGYLQVVGMTADWQSGKATEPQTTNQYVSSSAG